MIPSTSLIPIRDDNPTRSFSFVTAGIIAVNVLVLLFEGSEFEERREETLTLEKPGETKFIRDIVISR